MKKIDVKDQLKTYEYMEVMLDENNNVKSVQMLNDIELKKRIWDFEISNSNYFVEKFMETVESDDEEKALALLKFEVGNLSAAYTGISSGHILTLRNDADGTSTKYGRISSLLDI